jgi:glycosyltransferase involved in cell wall biosynthesis
MAGRLLQYLAIEFERVTVIPWRSDGIKARAMPKGVYGRLIKTKRWERVEALLHRWKTYRKSVLNDKAKGLKSKDLNNYTKLFAQYAAVAERIKTIWTDEAELRAEKQEGVWRVQHLSLWFAHWPTVLALAGQPYRTLARAWDVHDTRHPFGFQPFRDLQFAFLQQAIGVNNHALEALHASYPEHLEKFSLNRLGTRDMGMGAMPSEGQRLTILTIGDARPVKGMDRMGDVLKLLYPTPVTWVHVGELAEGSVGSDYGLPHLEISQHPTMRHEELMAWLPTQKNHVYVIPSLHEGVPSTLLEAMSLGIPSLGADVGGIGEALSDDVGILLPTWSAEEAAKAVVELASASWQSPEKRSQIRAHWQAKFDSATLLPILARSLRMSCPQ